MQKRANRANLLVLIFLAGANFWAKHAKNYATMSIAHITFTIEQRVTCIVNCTNSNVFLAPVLKELVLDAVVLLEVVLVSPVLVAVVLVAPVLPAL